MDLNETTVTEATLAQMADTPDPRLREIMARQPAAGISNPAGWPGGDDDPRPAPPWLPSGAHASLLAAA